MPPPWHPHHLNIPSVDQYSRAHIQDPPAYTRSPIRRGSQSRSRGRSRSRSTTRTPETDKRKLLQRDREALHYAWADLGRLIGEDLANMSPVERATACWNAMVRYYDEIKHEIYALLEVAIGADQGLL